MAATRTSVAKPAFGDGIIWFAALKDHAQSCDDCLGEYTLAVVALRVCGELVFEIKPCSEGERILANVSRSLRHHELAMSFPLRSDGPATTPPGQGAVAQSRLPGGGH